MRKRIKIKPKPVYSWNEKNKTINIQNKKENDDKQITVRSLG